MTKKMTTIVIDGKNTFLRVFQKQNTSNLDAENRKYTPFVRKI